MCARKNVRIEIHLLNLDKRKITFTYAHSPVQIRAKLIYIASQEEKISVPRRPNFRLKFDSSSFKSPHGFSPLFIRNAAPSFITWFIFERRTLHPVTLIHIHIAKNALRIYRCWEILSIISLHFHNACRVEIRDKRYQYCTTRMKIKSKVEISGFISAFFSSLICGIWLWPCENCAFPHSLIARTK